MYNSTQLKGTAVLFILLRLGLQVLSFLTNLQNENNFKNYLSSRDLILALTKTFCKGQELVFKAIFFDHKALFEAFFENSPPPHP